MAGLETEPSGWTRPRAPQGHADTAGDAEADPATPGRPAAGGLWTAAGVTGRVAAPLQAVEAAVTGWRHNPLGIRGGRWLAAVALQVALPNRFAPGHRLVS